MNAERSEAPDLFTRYPYTVGSRGIDTSMEAADHIAPSAGVLRDRVLSTVTGLGDYGTTVLEMANGQGLDRMGIQPRFSELRAMGKIADSGLRRKNPSGVSAIVWTLPEHVLPVTEAQ